MNVFNLFAKLTLDKTDYDKNIDDAKEKQKDLTDATESNNKKSIASWGKLAAAIAAVGVAVAAIRKIAMESINLADNFDEMSKRTQIAVSALQEYNYIALQNGLTIETLTNAMSRMQNTARGSSDVFKRLGINVNDANGNFKQANILFDEVIGALEHIEGEGDRTNIMLEIFGRNATQLGEVLRLGANGLQAFKDRAHELGIVMSDEVILAAADFNDTLLDMSLRFKTVVANMLAGKETAEEDLKELLADITFLFESYLPTFLQFGAKLLFAIVQGIWQNLPQIAEIGGQLAGELVAAIFEINWLQVGWEIISGIFKGFISGIGKLFGFERSKDFVATTADVQSTLYNVASQTSTASGIKTELDINLNLSGDTPTDEATAEQIANAIYPLIDKKLGSIV